MSSATVVQLLKNLPVKAGNTREVASIPELGRSPGEETGNSLQYSYHGRGDVQATVHGVLELVTTEDLSAHGIRIHISLH